MNFPLDIVGCSQSSLLVDFGSCRYISVALGIYHHPQCFIYAVHVMRQM